jgi:hypothetical protein
MPTSPQVAARRFLRPAIQLRKELTCVHCWARCQPEELLWVAEHQDLLGDPLLGEDHPSRFLPTRFTVNGDAVDARRLPCHRIACPACHLPLPRALLEVDPVFVSILGTPSCGKSYYLASLTWSLRRRLQTSFHLNFTDADAVENQGLINYEESIFLREDPDQRILLADLVPKTQLHGDLYNTVRLGSRTVTFAKPFCFLLEPTEAHQNYQANSFITYLVSLYDNAGEHFLPGQDTANAPGTRHLAESRLLLFLFDPTQDRRLDQVIGRASSKSRRTGGGRQEAVLNEAAARVRRHLGLSRREKHKKPLFVVLTKADVWASAIRGISWSEPWFYSDQRRRVILDGGRIEDTSRRCREFLVKHVPEIVAAAEAFSEDVQYIPVSALGAAPTADEQGRSWIRPKDVDPKWVSVPFIYGLSLVTQGVIPRM